MPFSDDGAGTYESYATGRVGINRLWIEINTVTRHDVVAFVVEMFVSFLFDYFGPGEDLVEVNIEPNVEWEGFTWGVVRKQNMKRLRETRYDLVLLPCSQIGILIDRRDSPGLQKGRQCLLLSPFRRSYLRLRILYLLRIRHF